MRLGPARPCSSNRILRVDEFREVGIRLHTFVEHNPRGFGSHIPFIRSLVASSKLCRAKNTAVNREFLSSTRKAASVRFHWAGPIWLRSTISRSIFGPP
jgi:hypothetical protein